MQQSEKMDMAGIKEKCNEFFGLKKTVLVFLHFLSNIKTIQICACCTIKCFKKSKNSEITKDLKKHFYFVVFWGK